MNVCFQLPSELESPTVFVRPSLSASLMSCRKMRADKSTVTIQRKKGE